jgi:hypothetical protein
MLYQVTHRAPSSLPLVVLCAVIAAGAAGCASAQNKALQQMEELNRGAIADLRKGRATEARKQLVEAVRVGSEAGLDEDPLMARTYLALGAIYAGPLKDRNRAVANMGKALAINPGVKLGGSLATAPARRALASARAERTARKGEAARKAEPEPAPPPERVARAEPAPAAPPPAPEPAPEPAPRPRKRVDIEPIVVAAGPPPEPAAPAALATGDDPLTCPVPDQAPPETEMTLRCVVQAGMKPRLSLFYRPSGTELFTEVPMRASKRGYYRGVVPASATTGKSLQFYVTGRGEPKLASGNAESPNLILVREGAPPVGSGPLGGGSTAEHDEDDDGPPGASSADENPLAAVERERERERADLHARPAKRWWVGFGMGSGYGWQPGGPLEFRTTQKVDAGPLGPGLLHILPEVGYQLGPQLAVSLQARAQFIPTQGSGDPTAGRPANKAFALLLRASYSLGEANTRPFFSVCAGGGDGFRLRVPASPGDNLVRSDTVKGGPLLGGAGGGVIHHFTSHVAWSTELRALAGFPTTAYMFELGTGIEVAF